MPPRRGDRGKTPPTPDALRAQETAAAAATARKWIPGWKTCCMCVILAVGLGGVIGTFVDHASHADGGTDWATDVEPLHTVLAEQSAIMLNTISNTSTSLRQRVNSVDTFLSFFPRNSTEVLLMTPTSRGTRLDACALATQYVGYTLVIAESWNIMTEAIPAPDQRFPVKATILTAIATAIGFVPYPLVKNIADHIKGESLPTLPWVYLFADNIAFYSTLFSVPDCMTKLKVGKPDDRAYLVFGLLAIHSLSMMAIGLASAQLFPLMVHALICGCVLLIIKVISFLWGKG